MTDGYNSPLLIVSEVCCSLSSCMFSSFFTARSSFRFRWSSSRCFRISSLFILLSSSSLASFCLRSFIAASSSSVFSWKLFGREVKHDVDTKSIHHEIVSKWLCFVLRIVCFLYHQQLKRYLPFLYHQCMYLLLHLNHEGLSLQFVY